ncbi:MAG: hypothetical protein A3D92_16860 [Bacteroidetes bacterium RIFCSPHIGHO2_02_FULL_44_7]|nr:MAG: hypothetical protein A3D92_16860 [Bacteroidetes bacterium RIFCSPHIGHO2_02_FULL_44_7]
MGVVISEYVVSKQSLFSDQELLFLNLFLYDMSNDLNQKMKEVIVTRLDDMKQKFYEIYLDEIRNADTAEEKMDAFKRAFDEANQKWPLRMIYIKPGWAEQGRGGLLPEIEDLSTGIHRKQISELYHYISNNDFQPTTALFQWMGYRPPRLLALDEAASAVQGGKKSVFKSLKDALFLNAYAQTKPDVESRLLKKYQPMVHFSGVFDFNPYLIFD